MRCIGVEFGADVKEWVGLCLSLVLLVVLLTEDRGCTGPERIGSGIGGILGGAPKDRHASGSNAQQQLLFWGVRSVNARESGKGVTDGLEE